MGNESSTEARPSDGGEYDAPPPMPVYYGSSVFSLWTADRVHLHAVEERIAIRKKWFVKLSADAPSAEDALCFGRVASEYAPEGDEAVYYGDIVFVRANIDGGRCLKPTLTGFYFFGEVEPVLGNSGTDGENCFRITGGVEGSVVTEGAPVVLESMEKPGTLGVVDGDYLKQSEERGDLFYVVPAGMEPPAVVPKASANTAMSDADARLAAQLTAAAAPHVTAAAQARYEQDPSLMIADAKVAAKYSAKVANNPVARQMATGLFSAALTGAKAAAKANAAQQSTSRR